MSLFLSFLLFAGSAGAPASWHWDWHKAQGCRLALAFAAAVRNSPCSPPSVPSVLPWRGSGPSLRAHLGTRHFLTLGGCQGRGAACVFTPPGPLCLVVFSCLEGLLLLPALVASQPALSPRGLIFPRHWAR